MEKRSGCYAAGAEHVSASRGEKVALDEAVGNLEVVGRKEQPV